MVTAGLYRYRVGDVLRVAGFKNEAPMFKFVRRQNVALSIDSDKTDETELHAAVSGAVQHLAPFGASLVEYTSCADAATILGHYVLFWELCAGSTAVPPSVFELALEHFCIHGAVKVKPYVPDFKLALEHFCIHVGGRGVLDELERSLGL